MGSYLHIGTLPYSSSKEVAIFNEHKLQFTQGLEIILTLDELKLCIDYLYLLQKLRYREIKVLIELCEELLEKDDYSNDDGEYLPELLQDIRSEIGFLAHNYKLEDHEWKDSIVQFKIWNEQEKPNEISSSSLVMSWAKEHFIEGEHYFYTV